MPRLRGRARDWGSVLAVLLGALTPDLVDKTLVLAGLQRWSRGVGHSLLLVAAATLLWLALRHWRPGAASAAGLWVLGIASHHLSDLANDLVRGILVGDMVFATWFGWPLAGPATLELRSPVALAPALAALPPFAITPLEALVILVTLALAIHVSRLRGGIGQR